MSKHKIVATEHETHIETCIVDESSELSCNRGTKGCRVGHHRAFNPIYHSTNIEVTAEQIKNPNPNAIVDYYKKLMSEITVPKQLQEIDRKLASTGEKD